MDPKVIIIGGGITGLSAARALQQRNIPFLLLEEAPQLGGRVQSEKYDGFILDKGFQILNTAYPEFKEQQINLSALQLKSFASGAKIFKNGKVHILADPQREFRYLPNAIFSGIATWSDLWKMYLLSNRLSHAYPDDVFKIKGISTMQYLHQQGFSESVLNHFFKPFYSGIFLESELKTPASMFAFVFAAFAIGHAALPEKGMQALPALLSAALPPESIKTGTVVSAVETGKVLLQNGTTLHAETILLATGTMPFEGVVRQNWNGNHQTEVYYYSLEKPLNLQRFVGLNARAEGVVNNFSMPSSVQPSYAPEGKHLLSVSLKPGIQPNQGMQDAVMKELQAITGENIEARFLKSFAVSAALPNLSSMNYQPEIITVAEKVYASGDFAAYPSLNAALHAGRLLAETAAV